MTGPITTSAVDKKKLVKDICQAWLISHKMGSDENGRIHYRSEDGTLSKEVVPPGELRALMEHPTTGVVAEAKKLAPKVDFSIYWSPPDFRETVARQIQEDSEATKGMGTARGG